jgi:hypothetical protein
MSGNRDPQDGPNDGDLSDEEVIERARKAENGDKFLSLWRADPQFVETYETTRAAQLALLEFLGFYTREDPEQMLRLYRRSDLSDREREDEPRGDDVRTDGGDDEDLARTAIRLRRDRDADSYSRQAP